MRIVYNLCFWSYVLTLMLYTTVIFGMLAQIALGVIHVLSAIYIYIFYSYLKKSHRITMNIYSFLVVVYFAGLGLIDEWVQPYDFNARQIYLFVIPMLIGAYFVAVIYQFRNIDQKPVKMHDMDILEEHS